MGVVDHGLIDESMVCMYERDIVGMDGMYVFDGNRINGMGCLYEMDGIDNIMVGADGIYGTH